VFCELAAVLCQSHPDPDLDAVPISSSAKTASVTSMKFPSIQFSPRLGASTGGVNAAGFSSAGMYVTALAVDSHGAPEGPAGHTGVKANWAGPVNRQGRCR